MAIACLASGHHNATTLLIANICDDTSINSNRVRIPMLQVYGARSNNTSDSPARTFIISRSVQNATLLQTLPKLWFQKFADSDILR